MYEQNSVLPRSAASPLDSSSPFHPAPDNTTIASNVLPCFLQTFMDIIWPSAFCSQQECMLCTFSGVISGSLSVKLLQCSHLPDVRETRRTWTTASKVSEETVWLLLFIYLFLNRISTEDG